MTDSTTRPPRTPDDDFEEMLAGMDRIINDKELQQRLLDAGLLVRIEPESEAAAPDAGLRRAVDLLGPYLQHESDCASRTPEGDCVCGLATAYDAALAAHRSSDPSPAPAGPAVDDVDRCQFCDEIRENRIHWQRQRAGYHPFESSDPTGEPE